MINKVILVGNLGADPEAKSTQGGNPVVTLRIATTERKKVGEKWEDHTEWHAVVAFGKTAEFASEYLKKGRQVYIEGKIQTRKWQDKDGNDRYSTEVVAFEVKALGPKPEGTGGGKTWSGTGGEGNYAKPSNGGRKPAAEPEYEEDIPF
jgi:single-strand DNA-binding protein